MSGKDQGARKGGHETVDFAELTPKSTKGKFLANKEKARIRKTPKKTPKNFESEEVVVSQVQASGDVSQNDEEGSSESSATLEEAIIQKKPRRVSDDELRKSIQEEEDNMEELLETLYNYSKDGDATHEDVARIEKDLTAARKKISVYRRLQEFRVKRSGEELDKRNQESAKKGVE